MVGGQEVREIAEILTGSVFLKGYSFSSSWTFDKKKKKETKPINQPKKPNKNPETTHTHTQGSYNQITRYIMHLLSFHAMLLQSMGMNLVEPVSDLTVTIVTVSAVKTDPVLPYS